MSEIIVFYTFALLSIFSAVMVLIHPNPIVCALYLVGAMVGVSGLFFNLNAPFIAAVQIMVYAGAVMVLFLFVVMIFDLKAEVKEQFSYGKIATFLKILFGGALAGLFLNAILFKIHRFGYLIPNSEAPQFEVRNLSKIMFTDYMFSFEVLGLMLLVIPIGTVALSRIRGGTHAE